MNQVNPLVEALEKERLHFLGCTALLDTPSSEEFDQITRLASQIFDVPISLVTFVDADRQWFKSRFGLDITETDRESSFCSHAIQTPEVLVIEDTLLDPRFINNRLVIGYPNIRFYAGAPLRLESGHALGSLCIIDTRPRKFSLQQRAQLATLANLTMTQIDLHQRVGRVNAVTRLPNRAQFFEDVEGLEAQASRGLMLLEVMNHRDMLVESRAVGSSSLESLAIAFAQKLKEIVGPETGIYHVGEMRFCLLLAGNSRSQYVAFATAILDRLRGTMSFDGRAIEVAPSAGLLEFDTKLVQPVDALRMASSALHMSAKTSAAYAWHDPAQDASHRRLYRLLREISGGLKNGEFRLVYQPKFNLRKRAFTGVEALARWRHPELGEVSPGEFIPLVESGALIHEFTRWALLTSLKQLALWNMEGIELTMAVNVSAKNLEEPRFVQDVRAICERSGVEPTRLHVECTENAVMTSVKTQAALEELRVMGTQTSLDDFGMGYSNLACLRSLPVEMLKLDQSLIKPIDTDGRAWRLVRSLIDLGHALGYRMLAEGVETKAAYDMLVSAGCDALQGYYLSRPIEAEDVVEFLRISGSKELSSVNVSD